MPLRVENWDWSASYQGHDKDIERGRVIDTIATSGTIIDLLAADIDYSLEMVDATVHRQSRDPIPLSTDSGWNGWMTHNGSMHADITVQTGTMTHECELRYDGQTVVIADDVHLKAITLYRSQGAYDAKDEGFGKFSRVRAVFA
jgi:hypothetical protein